jgi:hypothetical protein
MITIYAPRYDWLELDYPPSNNSRETHEALRAAVRAHATLNEPLAFLLTQSERDEATRCLAEKLDWLESNASFIMEGGKPQRSREQWERNISLLSAKLIETYYMQGQEGKHKLPLTYPPISDEQSGGFTYQLLPMMPEMWVLFVQAAMARHWTMTISTRPETSATGEEHYAAYNKAEAFISEAALRLTHAYPVLRSKNEADRLIPVCSFGQQAVPYWVDNIRDAAKAFGSSQRAAAATVK